MALLEDAIKEISDNRLRQLISKETRDLKNLLTESRRFGLVFEDHQPELLAVFGRRIRRGDRVAKKAGSLSETYHVRRIAKDTAELQRDADGEIEDELLSRLVSVRRMGESIYPALVLEKSLERGNSEDRNHILVEADNYHALQLLDYIYRGKVDCMYLDPPYNTGAHDWKYNNAYVDSNDQWRHSKWLSFMEKRLTLARRLLNPSTGVLAVTVDEHEVHHLGMLLERVFPDAYRQMVSIVVNPKGVTQGRFSRVEEYAIFCFMKDAYVFGRDDDLLTPDQENALSAKKPRWKGLLRSGTNARRVDRKDLFFPVLVDPGRGAVVDAGEILPFEQEPNFNRKIRGLVPVWPVRKDLSLGNWNVSPPTLRKLINQGYVGLGKLDPKRNSYGIMYLSQGLQDQIKSGAVQVVSHDQRRNRVEVEYVGAVERQIKTIWHRTAHDAGAYGSDILTTLLGKPGLFPFPKSIYAVRDTLSALVGDRPKAIILDFFAGSGTTLHSTCLLNAEDGGQRQCIMVTNNEVSEEDSKALLGRGLQPGDQKWESRGICRAITWPRLQAALTGRQANSTMKLRGEYATRRTTHREKPRTVRQLPFANGKALNVTQRKALAGLLKAVPLKEVASEAAWFLNDAAPESVLWDATRATEWLDALADADQVSDLYVVTSDNRLFDKIKSRVKADLGPLVSEEKGTIALSAGFPENISYFKLDFLDPNEVQMGQQLAAIIPILWMMAGAKGTLPTVPSANVPWFIPDRCSFALLLRESRFRDFHDKIKEMTNLTHVFIVTNSRDVFLRLRDEIKAKSVIQLYKSYLENFKINIIKE